MSAPETQKGIDLKWSDIIPSIEKTCFIAPLNDFVRQKIAM